MIIEVSKNVQIFGGTSKQREKNYWQGFEGELEVEKTWGNIASVLRVILNNGILLYSSLIILRDFYML